MTATFLAHPEYIAHAAGIVADPADDLRRQVLADWLDERGHDERAELIRVGVELQHTERSAVQTRVLSEFDWYAMPREVRLARKSTFEYTDRRNRLGTETFTGDSPAWLKLYGRQLELIALRGHEWAGVSGWTHVAAYAITDPRAASPVAVWDRGFILRVKCPLGVWVGGRCPRCDGRGTVEQDQNTPETEWVWFGDRVLYGTFDCPACDGRREVPGVGRAIAAGHPLETVRITDREPYRGEATFHWLSNETRYADRGTHRPANLLPGTLFASPHISSNHMPRAFAYLDDARLALSAACISWARSPA